MWTEIVCSKITYINFAISILRSSSIFPLFCRDPSRIRHHIVALGGEGGGPVSKQDGGKGRSGGRRWREGGREERKEHRIVSPFRAEGGREGGREASSSLCCVREGPSRVEPSDGRGGGRPPTAAREKKRGNGRNSLFLSLPPSLRRLFLPSMSPPPPPPPPSPRSSLLSGAAIQRGKRKRE